MINTWLITGDKHGNFLKLNETISLFSKPEETAVIILGDAGLNFYLNKTDQKIKQSIQNIGYMVYVVRGNHEARPQSLPNIEKIYDENVHNVVYYEKKYPNIRYFLDYGAYKIKNYYIFVIGGAYSVDKWWRLLHRGFTEETNIPTKTGWWPDEQLSEDEMLDCMDTINFFSTIYSVGFDFIFTHTCPLEWEPTDLFLPEVDQDKVDNTMELWLNEVKDKVSWKAWCFGHFHSDRKEAPHVRQFFNDIRNLDDVYNELTQE
jgi:3-oxoacid CoA-transferase subunit A